MDNQEEEQEFQGEEEEGIDEGPHPKTPSPTSPKVAKKVDPPPPSPIREKTNAERDALPYCDDKVSSEESEDERQELAKFLGVDQYGFWSPFKKTEKSESPADSDVNQENAKQFESSDEESVESKSPVGPRYSPVTSAVKTGSTNSGRSLADSKFQTQTRRPKWELSDEERVELKSPVVSGNAPVASALKTESTDNCHGSPADSRENEAFAAVSTDNEEEEQELQEEEEGIDEGPHPKTSSLTASLHTPIREKTDAEWDALLYCDEKLSFSEENKDEQQELKFESSGEETVESKSPVGPRNSPVTSALKTGSTNSGKSLADSNTNEEKDKWELPDEERVELKSPVVSGNAPVASALKTESTDNCHESPTDSSGNEASAAVNDSQQVKKRRTQRTSPDHKLN